MNKKFLKNFIDVIISHLLLLLIQVFEIELIAIVIMIKLIEICIMVPTVSKHIKMIRMSNILFIGGS